MSKIRLCYRVSEDVGLAQDELGNNTEAFTCVKIDVKQDPMPSQEYKDLQDGFRKIVANELECDEKLVVPVTLNEYLNNTQDDD